MAQTKIQVTTHLVVVALLLTQVQVVTGPVLQVASLVVAVEMHHQKVENKKGEWAACPPSICI